MTDQATAPADRWKLLAGAGLWVVALLVVGAPRALSRHYHVDETQVSYEAALLAIHDLPDYASGTTPVLIVLGWAMKRADSAVTMLAIARILFFSLFAAKLVACAWAQPYFTSLRGRLAVLAVATLFLPLWLNGFEIRMDVVVSLGSVVLFGLAQRAARDPALAPPGYFAAGLCAASMQASSIKALAYWAPFSLVLLAIGLYRERRRGRIVGAYLLGIAAGLALNLGLVIIAGRWGVYARGMTSIGALLDAAMRFSPTTELVRLATISPLAFALAAAQPILLAVALVKRRRAPRSILTLVFLAWSFATLYLNPVPFAYNFIHLLPFVLFAALDTVASVMDARPKAGRVIAVAAGAATLALFVRGWLYEPFLVRRNDAQVSYIRAAEALTGPDDTVLDAVGLVLSRRPPHKDWLVHSLRMGRYRDGFLTRYATIMREHPSPVIVDNYRWEWLSPEDLETRSTRYVTVAPRLLVLGELLRAPEGDIEVHLAGTYQVVAGRGIALTLDGEPLANGATLHLAAGAHSYTRTGEGVAGVRWIGPNPARALDAMKHIKSLGRGELLFTNEPFMVPR